MKVLKNLSAAAGFIMLLMLAGVGTCVLWPLVVWLGIAVMLLRFGGAFKEQNNDEKQSSHETEEC